MEILQRSCKLECKFLLILYAPAHCTGTGAQSPGPAQSAYCIQQARAHECLQWSNCKLHFQCVHDMSYFAEAQGVSPQPGCVALAFIDWPRPHNANLRVTDGTSSSSSILKARLAIGGSCKLASPHLQFRPYIANLSCIDYGASMPYMGPLPP